LRTGCEWQGVGDDPAIGSAAVSRSQAPFDGSDRQARGRLMKALAKGPISPDQARSVMVCGAERADRLIDALVAEGLVQVDGPALRLP
ncbi:MAG TPA: hypothetical protein VIH06_18775, partial [Ilumatobacteraceae bacterium]